MRTLTDERQNRRVLRRASALVEAGPTSVHDSALDDAVEVEARHCARSRQQLAEALDCVVASGDDTRPIELSIVWAMYRETNRIQPRSEQNPHGEDFLREKVRQIRWLAGGLNVRWHLIAVDDGCPDAPMNSAGLAREIRGTISLDPSKGERITVLELKDALGRGARKIAAGLSDTFRQLGSTDESRKGGSILYGLWHALDGSIGLQPARSRHIVIYTDADLSTNLAQAGLITAPILRGDAAAVAGQRYGVEGAFLVKNDRVMAEPESTASKPDNMIMLFRHTVRQQLMPGLAHVPDTQAGFKAFDAEALATTVPTVASFDETFDVELLLRFVQARKPEQAKLGLAPIVFVEDLEQSNFPSAEPSQRHVDMIIQLVETYERLVEPGAKHVEELQPIVRRLRDLTLDGYTAALDRLKAMYVDQRAEIASKDSWLFDWPVPLNELVLEARTETTQVAPPAFGGIPDPVGSALSSGWPVDDPLGYGAPLPLTTPNQPGLT